MESIDRLRKWWHDRFPVMDRELGQEFRWHIDRIEREVGEMQRALTIDAKPMTDENMAESGWVRLPVDADGEPIHIGDVMENIVCPSVHREVTGVGVECFYGWDDGNGRYSQFDVNCYRHHHAPTVEDVLEEFVARWMETHHDDIPALKAEYAAKLTLRGDE